MSEAAPRKDIQALRAVAVAMVVVFHLWPAALPGGYIGVDVFLVISGFLITRHLLQREPTSARALADFWSRRIRRLLPAATGALVGTAILALTLMPSTGFLSLARSTIASAFAVENWNLIALSSDYLAADDDPSPVQHFWSLGVEEQFYFVWPLIIALCMAPFIARHSRKAVGAAVILVVAVSFALSVVLTGTGGALAYFATVTRVWELGIGAILAVWHVSLVGRGPRWLRLVAWWGGAAVIAYAGVTLADVSVFPGYIALLPVVGTAAMIAAHGDSLRFSASRIFSSLPVQWVGDRSYSIYLWHWPLIVALGAVLANAAALAVAVLFGTLVLAAASKRWLEDVPRTAPRLVRSRRATAGLLVACTAASVGAGAALWAVQEREARTGEVMLAAAHGDPCLGAATARDPECVEPALAMTPVQASHDKPVVYADDCWNSRPFTSRTVCHYGAPAGELRVALIGNSHAGQWQPPLASAIVARGWSLDTYLASECYPAGIELEFGSRGLNRNCVALQEWMIDEVVDGGYDLVVIASRSFQAVAGVPRGEQHHVRVDGYSQVLERFAAAGIAIIAIRDTPYPREDIPQCLASRVERDCSTARSTALPPDPLVEAASALAEPGATILDASNVLCGPDRCEPVIGGLIVNFDQGHFTSAFASSLEPEVSAALDAATASGRAP